MLGYGEACWLVSVSEGHDIMSISCAEVLVDAWGQDLYLFGKRPWKGGHEARSGSPDDVFAGLEQRYMQSARCR